MGGVMPFGGAQAKGDAALGGRREILRFAQNDGLSETSGARERLAQREEAAGICRRR
jgi:hypothetical protein